MLQVQSHKSSVVRWQVAEDDCGIGRENSYLPTQTRCLGTLPAAVMLHNNNVAIFSALTSCKAHNIMYMAANISCSTPKMVSMIQNNDRSKAWQQLITCISIYMFFIQKLFHWVHTTCLQQSNSKEVFSFNRFRLDVAISAKIRENWVVER